SLPASVFAQTIRPARSGGSPASRIAASTPHCRYISMVRALMPRALGCSAVPGWRSISKERTPACDNKIDAVSPTGPPPTIRTGTTTAESAMLLSRLRRGRHHRSEQGRALSSRWLHAKHRPTDLACDERGDLCDQLRPLEGPRAGGAADHGAALDDRPADPSQYPVRGHHLAESQSQQ